MPPEWHSDIRHYMAVLEASLQTQLWAQALSQPAATGRPMRQRTIGPESSGLGEDLGSREGLVPSCASDSLWRAGRIVSPFVWCFLWRGGAAGFRVKRALRPCFFSRDAWLSTFASPESLGELHRWAKAVTTNWVSRKRGTSFFLNNATCGEFLHGAFTVHCHFKSASAVRKEEMKMALPALWEVALGWRGSLIGVCNAAEVFSIFSVLSLWSV